MADDLDDQWRIPSDDDDESVADDNINNDTNDEHDSSSTQVVQERGVKRKASNADVQKESISTLSEVKKSEVKKKRRNKRRITEASQVELSKQGTNKDVRTMMLKSLREKLHADVLKEILPDPAVDFYICNSNQLPPSDYFTSILPNWREMVKKNLYVAPNGSPCVLVVTSSAVRAVNLIRDLKAFCGEKCKVGKLFSKHIKIEEQKKFLTKSKCQLGVGTPNRLLALIKQEALQTEHLTTIVLDWNWRNPKMKRLPDIPEIQSDLSLLLMDHLMGIVKGSSSSCKLALL